MMSPARDTVEAMHRLRNLRSGEVGGPKRG